MWNDAFDLVMVILMSLGGGIGAGILASIIVKYFVKTRQEKIYEKNRIDLIKIMLCEIYIPYCHVKDVFHMLGTKEGFKPNTIFSSEFSDEIYKHIQNIRNQIYNIAFNLPSFYESSGFLSLEEYAAIKQFVLSCDICYFIDGSRVNQENVIGYAPRYILHTTLYAKKLIKLFRPYLKDYFIDEWSTIIKDEGMEHSDSIKAKPGDIVPPYVFIHEILDKDYQRKLIGF